MRTRETTDERPTEAGRQGGPDWLDWPSLASGEAGDWASELATWMSGHVMRPHPSLGRAGHVCPYVAQAARLNLMRFAVSHAPSPDLAAARALIAAAQDMFDALPCPAGKETFRSTIVVFPACRDPEAIALLRKAQHSVRFDAVRRHHMIGLFHPGSTETGIVDRSFAAFQAPLPLIAVRPLVHQDALFVLRNPPMIPAYLATFGRRSATKLWKAATLRIRERLDG